MQLWEDITTSDMQQGQMDVKSVSWLIWKEHATLWENIWAGALFCRIEDKNPSFLTLLQTSVILTLLCHWKLKMYWKATAKLKAFCVCICLGC